MTLKQWTLGDGLADATGLTTANLLATDGTAALLVSAGTGGSIRATTANKHDGTAAMRQICGTTQSLDTRFPLTANTKQAVSFERFIGAAPGFSVLLAVLRDTAQAGLIRIVVNAANKIEIQSGTGAIRGTSAAAITENRFNRFEIIADIGSSATTGNCTVNVYQGHNTGTPDATVTVTGVNLGGTGSNQMGGLTIGVGLVVASSIQQDIDSLQTNDGATTAIGPWPTNAAPIASFTKATSGLVLSTTSTSTDSDGTIASYDWDWGDGTAHGTGSTGSHTYAAGGTYTVTLTVTDNSGATASTSQSATVAAANVAPTANAGVDQSVSAWQTVSLTGAAADSDGTISSQSWSQISGTAVTLSGSGASRTFPAPGTLAGATLVFRFSATDNSGATTTDDMTVTVAAAAERIVSGGVEVPIQFQIATA